MRPHVKWTMYEYIYIYIRYRFIVKLCPSTVPAQLYEQDTSIHTHEIQIQDNFFLKSLFTMTK